jgi:hypothetical protein
MSKIEMATCGDCGNTFARQRQNVEKSVARNGYYMCATCYQSNRKRNKGTPIHNSYAGAKQRCCYPAHTGYANYGGRGIKFLWDSFEDFYNDMAGSWFNGATLDRIDVDGDYCKENCRWVTQAQQAHNTRRNIHTEETVREIRRLYRDGVNQVELARMYNDSQGNISNIIVGRTWII